MFFDKLRIPRERKTRKPDQLTVQFMNVNELDAEKSSHEVQKGDFRLKPPGGTKDRLPPA